MAEYGLTEGGFKVKSLDDCVQTLKDRFIAKPAIGEGFNVSDESFFGQSFNAEGEQEEEIWGAMALTVASFNPNTATGVHLDDIGALTNTSRGVPTKSLVINQSFIGTTGTVIPALTEISKSTDPSIIFQTTEDVTLISGSNCVQRIAFSEAPTSGSYKLKLGSFFTDFINYDSTNSEIELLIEALPNVKSVTISGDTTLDILIEFDGEDAKRPFDKFSFDSNTTTKTITISYVVYGTYQALVSCLAKITGSDQNATAGSLDTLDDVITAIEFTSNVEDAIVGSDGESDVEYRISRKQRLAGNGYGTTNAVRSEVLNISPINIEYCAVFENKKEIEVNGWPPKSIIPFVLQAEGSTTLDQNIGEAIYKKKAGGIESFGDIDVTVLDDSGFPQIVQFSRPDSVPIFSHIQLTVNSSFPSNGEQLVIDAIVAGGESLGIGQDVVPSPTMQSWIADIPGINISVIAIQTFPAFYEFNPIVIDNGTLGNVEYSSWDPADIDLTIIEA